MPFLNFGNDNYKITKITLTQKGKQMKFFSVKTLVAGLSLLFFFGCSGEQKAPQMPPALVSTITAQASDVKLSFSYPAQLVSEEDVVLKPKVSGSIVEKLFKAGDRVQKDQVLFLIEPERYKASYEVARASLLVAEANYQNAKKDHDRNRVLIGKQAISQKEYDTSLATFNTAKANLESARAQLSSSQLDLNYTSVSAPFDGVVGDALVNVGEYVATNSKDLVRVTNLNPIYADFYISDVERLGFDRNVASGSWQVQDIETTINVGGQEFKGKLFFVDSVLDSNSGSAKAKAVFDNNESRLVPGTYTTITSSGFVQKDGFKIPQIAVLQDARNTYVYTIGAENKVQKTIVKIIYQDNEFAVISEGLKNGDKVIINNFKKIRPGSVVQEIPPQAMQAPQG